MMRRKMTNAPHVFTHNPVGATRLPATSPIIFPRASPAVTYRTALCACIRRQPNEQIHRTTIHTKPDRCCPPLPKNVYEDNTVVRNGDHLKNRIVSPVCGESCDAEAFFLKALPNHLSRFFVCGQISDTNSSSHRGNIERLIHPKRESARRVATNK